MTKIRYPTKWEAAGRTGIWRHKDWYTSNKIDGIITREGKPTQLLPCLP